MQLSSQITLTELRYVIALAQEKHFAKAAKKCFVSQPTLSIAIRKIEETLGVIIFERNKNQIIITSIGQQLIDAAINILENTNKLVSLAKSYTLPYEEPIKIGAIHTVGPYLFPEAIAKLQQNSAIKLIIEEDYTLNLQKKLLTGSLDAIIVAAPFDLKNLSHIKLYDEPLDLIIPPNHHWNKLITINPTKLNHETILLLNQGNCFRDAVLKICPQCLEDNNKQNNIISTTSLETIKYMVALNLGISIMPRSAIHKNNQSYLIKEFAPKTPFREIILVYRESFPRFLLLNELSKFLIKQF